MDETLVTFGGEVKSLGDNKFGGYLVRFTDESNPDLTGDFFTKETDFDMEFPGKATVYFNHGLDSNLKRRKFDKATLTIDDVGIWAEKILQERDEYEKKLAELAKAGKLGWSSGTASHLVERTPVGKSYRIDKWSLGLDASLTHTPAEPRNGVMALKSLLPQENIDMEKEELVTILGDCKSEMAKAATESAEAAVKKFADELAPEGPGFIKDDFVKYLRSVNPGLSARSLVVETRRVGRGAVQDVIGLGILERIHEDIQLGNEVRLMSDLLSRIAQGLPAAYGRAEVQKAIDFGACERLLVSDTLIRDEAVVHMMDRAELLNAGIVVFSSGFEPGKQLEGLGGIAALLRYQIG